MPKRTLNFSDKEFPPTTVRAEEIEFALNILATAIPTRSAIYVSAPITSGRRSAEWYRTLSQGVDLSNPEYASLKIEHVIKPNTDAVQPIITALREHEKQVVIDPTALISPSGWTQGDFRFFWGAVVKRFASTVMFLDGWTYSAGCAYEYLVASECALRTIDVNRQDITVSSALLDLQVAIEELRLLEMDTAFQDAVFERLRAMAVN